MTHRLHLIKSQVMQREPTERWTQRSAQVRPPKAVLHLAAGVSVLSLFVQHYQSITQKQRGLNICQSLPISPSWKKTHLGVVHLSWWLNVLSGSESGQMRSLNSEIMRSFQNKYTTHTHTPKRANACCLTLYEMHPNTKGSYSPHNKMSCASVTPYAVLSLNLSLLFSIFMHH